MTRPVRQGLVVTAAAVAAIVAAELIAFVVAGIRPRLLLNDPGQLAGVPGWYGAVSFVGLAGWVVAATAAGTAASVLPRDAPTRGALIGIAVLSAVLVADDAIQLHEGFSHLTGLPEVTVQASYAAFALVLVWRHARDVRPEWTLLVVAGLGLATSMVIDVAGDSFGLDALGSGFAEDNAKLLGVVAWAVASVALARRTLSSAADGG